MIIERLSHQCENWVLVPNFIWPLLAFMIILVQCDSQIVCSTNARASYWNNFQSARQLDLLSAQSKDGDQDTFRVISSYDIISHGFCENMSEEDHQDLLNKISLLPRSKTAGIPKSCLIVTGKKMVVTANLYRKNKLVIANSELVKILKFKEKSIDVETDQGEIVKIRPVSRNIFVKTSDLIVDFTRVGYQLDEIFALTSHFLQGSTRNFCSQYTARQIGQNCGPMLFSAKF